MWIWVWVVAAAAAARACQCEAPLTTGQLPCCTNTRGYWRTHNKYALQMPWADYTEGCPHAPPFDEDTVAAAYFQAFRPPSTTTMLQVLETPVGTDVCFEAAAQFVAAALSACRGACADQAVAAALERLPRLIGAHCAGGAPDGAALAEIEGLKDTLDAYNSGVAGPGQCTDNRPAECSGCDGGCVRQWAAAAQPWPAQCAQGNATRAEDNVLYGGAVTWQQALAAAAEAAPGACAAGGRQLVAASLNVCALGACTTQDVNDAMARARQIIDRYCPLYPLVGAGQIPADTDDALAKELLIAREQLLGAASVLSAYNNGRAGGPGTCIEPGAGASAAAAAAGGLAGLADGLRQLGEGMKKESGVLIATLALVSATLVLLFVWFIVWMVRKDREAAAARYRSVEMAGARAAAGKKW